MDRNRKVVYSVEKAKERVEVWKQRLDIDWTIEMSFTHQMNLPPDVQGQISIFPMVKRASLLLPSPETYSVASVPNQDMEDTIVHELVHVLFETLDHKDKPYAENVMYERGIRQITTALLNAYEHIDGEIQDDTEAQG